MPEGDTVYRQCKVLDEALAGGTLTAAELRVPGSATANLAGWRVQEVVPRGKHLLIRLMPPQEAGGAGDIGTPSRPRLTLHNHLMMDGIWHVDGKALRSSDTTAGPRPAHTLRIRLTVQHRDGRTVVASGWDVKQVRLIRTSDEYELIGHLGPDLLDADWGEEHREQAVMNLVRQADRELGLALLDQQVMAGLGNIYRSELCFLQRVHPAVPVSSWIDSGGDPGAMVDLAHRLLVLNKDRTVRVTTGGMMGRDGDMWVYGRSGKPCRRCGARIQRGMLADPSIEGSTPRVIHTCPRCQGEAPASR
ncbi:endonuclease-8 [Brachybacterium muris]|uniref:DNA-formamidopyrimidine glycosylase family protein n=1 Tax=Brachybacterium muris TaxID=219301 RepID=UPI00195E9881|nr:endonuclease-8 [Brachybacterium muris]MCT2296495.1 formamidopyrimidine-DNA glycosylase [Brachybacterium muris]